MLVERGGQRRVNANRRDGIDRRAVERRLAERRHTIRRIGAVDGHPERRASGDRRESHRRDVERRSEERRQAHRRDLLDRRGVVVT